MTALPSLRQLSYLVALADSRHFTLAAQACFVTQSTLSGGLQELERTLGAQLVERTRQRVALTDVGAEVVIRARALLAMAHDLADHAAQAARPMTGLIRLGAIPTIAPYLLPRLLRALREQHTALRTALREDQSAPLLARVREGSLDFALIALPYDTHGLRVQAVLDDELWLIAPTGDPALKRANLRVEAIDAQRLLLLEEGHCLRSHALTGCRLSESANPNGLEATSLATLVQMVEEGLGIALVPEIALKAGLIEGGSLIARPLAAPAPRRQIALVARDTSARGAEFDALAAMARSLFAAPRALRKPRAARQSAADQPSQLAS